jgi:hypothetical protein
MAAPFAAIESRINEAATKHLANVTADFGSGLLVESIFDNGYQESLGLVAGTAPQLLCRAASIASVNRGASVTVNGSTYTVAEIHADGIGMKRLILED